MKRVAIIIFLLFSFVLNVALAMQVDDSRDAAVEKILAPVAKLRRMIWGKRVEGVPRWLFLGLRFNQKLNFSDVKNSEFMFSGERMALCKSIQQHEIKNVAWIFGEHLKTEEKITMFCSVDEIEWIDKKLLIIESEKRRMRHNRKLVKLLCEKECDICTGKILAQDHKLINLLKKYT